MTLDLDVTVLIPCEWCDAYDGDEPLIAVEHGQLNLCVACYVHDYCVPCRLCDTLVEPGVYEILRTPFYRQPLIGPGRLWSDQLRLVATLTPFDDGEAPCGDLCECCRIDAQHGWSQALEKRVSQMWSDEMAS